MGTVYRAVHVSLGAPRALKVMRRELVGDPDLAERFRAEARLAEGLRHPSLVALYDFGQIADRGWYIVQRVRGGGDPRRPPQAPGGLFSSADPWTLRERSKALGLSGFLSKDVLGGNLGGAVERLLA
jgi:serine/threonine-protein kinase